MVLPARLPRKRLAPLKKGVWLVPILEALPAAPGWGEVAAARWRPEAFGAERAGRRPGVGVRHPVVLHTDQSATS